MVGMTIGGGGFRSSDVPFADDHLQCRGRPVPNQATMRGLERGLRVLEALEIATDFIAARSASRDGHSEAEPAARAADPRAISPGVATARRRPLSHQHQSDAEAEEACSARMCCRGRSAGSGSPVPEGILAVRHDGAGWRSHGHRRNQARRAHHSSSTPVELAALSTGCSVVLAVPTLRIAPIRKANRF